MAKFLKVETTTAGKAAVLIPIDGILSATVANNGGTTTLSILMNDAGAGVYAITVADPAGGDGALLDAYNSALTANPGGIVSTLVPPLTTAQVPAAQSGQQGRIVVTTAAVYTPFANCIFTP
jgi:hypothetical protein